MRKLMITRRSATRALAASVLMLGGAALPAAAQQNPIVIGGTLGLTGAFAEPSTDYKAVYDLWLEQVNKKGGILGRPVKMIIYNDESNPTVAQALYNRLLDQDKVDLVLAPYTTFVGGARVSVEKDCVEASGSVRRASVAWPVAPMTTTATSRADRTKRLGTRCPSAGPAGDRPRATRQGRVAMLA